MSVQMRPGSLRAMFAGLAMCLMAGVWSAPVRGQNADIAVIANPQVPVDNLSLTELRRMLLGDREFWTAGQRIILLIRAPVARERDAAVQTVCKMTEAQFRQHWIGKVFRAETPSGPKIVYSPESTIEQVSRTPGAIGLVQSPVTARNVKVLKIDGRAPGQSGYKL